MAKRGRSRRTLAIAAATAVLAVAWTAIAAAALAGRSAPLVVLTAPANGAVVTGDVVMTATATDDGAVKFVAFFVNGKRLVRDYVAPYEATWPSASRRDGTYTLRARAVDTSGKRTLSEPVVVLVANTTPPTTSPPATTTPTTTPPTTTPPTTTPTTTAPTTATTASTTTTSTTVPPPPGSSYYVDFAATAGSTCNDTGPGTRTQPWCTVPGTRTATATGWASTKWGPFTKTNPVSAGTTIFIKGGTTHRSTRGGTIVIGNCVNTDCTAGSSESGFYGSGSPTTPIQIKNGSEVGWGAGPVTIDCEGMRILSPWDFGCLHISDWWDTANVGDWVWVRGFNDQNPIRIVNSENHGVFTYHDPEVDTHGLEGDAFEYIEVANNAGMGINVSNARWATIKNVFADDNGSSGISMGLGNGDDGVLSGTILDSRAEHNGAASPGNNAHGFNFFDCGTLADACVNLRGITSRNIRDGADNGLLGRTVGAFTLYIDLQSYDNAEDGMACSGDERGIGTFTCSLIGGRLYNNTNDGTCVYEDGATQYVTNSVLQRNGSWANGSAGGFGVVHDGATVKFVGRNNIVYKPNEARTVFDHCGSSAGGGTPVKQAISNLFIPRNGDGDGLAPGINHDNAPGTYFNIFTGNKLGISSPNYDNPPVFKATNDASYSGNDYTPSGPTSAAVDAGSHYCTVTSASGSGATFSVNCDPRLYFYAKGNRPLVPADVAFLGGGTGLRCTIVALTSSSITCANTVTWSQGHGVSRTPVYGAAPDIGVVERQP